MKIKELNASFVDLSDSEDCVVSFPQIPSKEEIGEFIGELFKELKEKGVSEVSQLNITVLDLSGAERVTLK